MGGVGLAGEKYLRWSLSPYNQSYGFSSSHVRIWELDHKGWRRKNWYLWTVVLVKTLESLLDCKEIKAVNPKGNQPRIFIGKPDAEAPVLWPPDGKCWLTGKHPDAGKDRGQKEKGVADDEMVIEHEMDMNLSKLQEIVACCTLWGCPESDMT